MIWKPQQILAVLFSLAGVMAPLAMAEPSAVQKARLADFPHVQSVKSLLGIAALKSTAGKDIDLIEFGPRATTPNVYRFLVQGGIHGNETQASAFVQWLARRYARGESALNRLPKDTVAIDFLPYANPDATDNNSRYNARGVNLNRNFGVLWGMTRENPGQNSFSEPETQAIRELFKARQYTAAVDVHGYINWIVAPSAPSDVMARGLKITNEQRNAYAQWTSALIKEMRSLPGYELKTGASLGDGGAFEDWAFWDQGSFAYCLELETFQRYVRQYPRDGSDLTKTPTAPAIDLWQRYEMFVYRMFANALRIKQSMPASDTWAEQAKTQRRSGT